MATNAGSLVTDAEVLAFVQTMNTVGVLETLIIQSVEDMIQNYCQRRFISENYTDESYFIRRPSLTWDQWVTNPRVDVRLKQYPVTRVTAVKQVTGRSITTGAPQQTETLQRDMYLLDGAKGIITFFNPIGIEVDPGVPGSALYLNNMPGNESVNYLDLLVSYTAGYDQDELPPRVKLATLITISRFYLMTSRQVWHLQGSESPSGTGIAWTAILRTGLTPEEKMLLDSFRMPVAA